MASPTHPTLNADVGEDEAAVFDGRQGALLDVVQLANVACGGHAGSRETMDATVLQCLARGVHIGAHPSVPDRAGFGRHPIEIARDALLTSVRSQVALLVDVAGSAGAALQHIKPHGALYHLASDDPVLAVELEACVRDLVPNAAWVLRARSAGLAQLTARGVHTLAEGFVDRRYASDGSLVPRDNPGALLDSPADAAAQAVQLAHQGGVHTLCIHGDGPHALAIARAVRAALEGRGVG